MNNKPQFSQMRIALKKLNLFWISRGFWIEVTVNRSFGFAQRNGDYGKHILKCSICGPGRKVAEYFFHDMKLTKGWGKTI